MTSAGKIEYQDHSQYKKRHIDAIIRPVTFKNSFAQSCIGRYVYRIVEWHPMHNSYQQKCLWHVLMGTLKVFYEVLNGRHLDFISSNIHTRLGVTIKGVGHELCTEFFHLMFLQLVKLHNKSFEKSTITHGNWSFVRRFHILNKPTYLSNQFLSFDQKMISSSISL